MDVTLNAQSGLREAIERAACEIEGAPDDEWSDGLVLSRLEMLDRHWFNFEDNHMTLLQSDTPRDHPYFYEMDFRKTETAYVKAKGRLYDLRNRFQPAPLGSSTPLEHERHGSTRLPRIVIPNFSGHSEEWESFRDLFLSLIHTDPHLSNVDKFYYLKTCVQGEAKSALESFQITDANYALAWETLEGRYDHQRLLVQEHIKALKTLQPLKEESSASIRQLHDELKRHRDQLRTLGRPVDSWDDWIISFACDAMDSVTQRGWEEELETLSTAEERPQHFHPSFSTLSAFLQRRCRTLQSVESKGKPRATIGGPRGADGAQIRQKAVKVLTTGLGACAVCATNHYLGHCPQFREKSASERRKFVERERLCYNCLRRDHSVRNCPSQSRCWSCDGHHHTLLHEGAGKRPGTPSKDGLQVKRKRTEEARDSSAPPERSEDSSA